MFSIHPEGGSATQEITQLHHPPQSLLLNLVQWNRTEYKPTVCELCLKKAGIKLLIFYIFCFMMVFLSCNQPTDTGDFMHLDHN